MYNFIEFIVKKIILGGYLIMKINYSNHISWQLLNNEIYIIDEITQKIYILTDVAKEFWILINGGYTVEEIINILIKIYKVSEKIIKNDINDFKDILISKKLITEGE